MYGAGAGDWKEEGGEGEKRERHAAGSCHGECCCSSHVKTRQWPGRRIQATSHAQDADEWRGVHAECAEAAGLPTDAGAGSGISKTE